MAGIDQSEQFVFNKFLLADSTLGSITKCDGDTLLKKTVDLPSSVIA